MRRLLVALALGIAGASAASAQALIGRDIDHVLTPGAIASTNIADVCMPDYDERHGRITEQLARAVFDRYGVTYQARMRYRYRVTFVIPASLGGANVITNLWPVDPATMQRKDAVDTDLHQAVCSGRMDLKEAQRRERTNWEKAVDF